MKRDGRMRVRLTEASGVEKQSPATEAQWLQERSVPFHQYRCATVKVAIHYDPISMGTLNPR